MNLNEIKGLIEDFLDENLCSEDEIGLHVFVQLKDKLDRTKDPLSFSYDLD